MSFLKERSEGTLNIYEYLPAKHFLSARNPYKKLARSEFNCVVRVLAAIQMKAFNMDSSTYGPLISGFGNALHLKGNSALVDFANQIGLSPCYQALETEKKLLFDMNYSKANVEKLDVSLLKQLQQDNIDVCKSINWLRVLGHVN